MLLIRPVVIGEKIIGRGHTLVLPLLNCRLVSSVRVPAVIVPDVIIYILRSGAQQIIE